MPEAGDPAMVIDALDADGAGEDTASLGKAFDDRNRFGPHLVTVTAKRRGEAEGQRGFSVW